MFFHCDICCWLKPTGNVCSIDTCGIFHSYAIGYNTWNGFIYYGLNPVFNEVSTTDFQPINISTLKIGLIFYIL